MFGREESVYVIGFRKNSCSHMANQIRITDQDKANVMQQTRETLHTMMLNAQSVFLDEKQMDILAKVKIKYFKIIL